jgi:hypothetical protein
MRQPDGRCIGGLSDAHPEHPNATSTNQAVIA